MDRPRLHRFDAAALPRSPWRNGGGTTREITCHPAASTGDAFDWRASIATIDADGPFSTFGGKQRMIMLLEGAGVRLQAPAGSGPDGAAAPGIDQRLETAYRPFAFSGDAAVRCSLLGGPSTDFNLMFDPGRCSASLQVIDAARALPASGGGVVLALRGGWRVDEDGAEGAVAPLAEGEGLWWTGSLDGFTVTPRGTDARLAVVLCGPAGWNTR